MPDVLMSLVMRNNYSIQQVADMITNDHNDPETLLQLNLGARFQIEDGPYVSIAAADDLTVVMRGDLAENQRAQRYFPTVICYVSDEQAQRLRWRVDPFARRHVEDLFT